MATAVGKHVDKLTRGVFSAHGFAYAQILTHWETIVGPELAEFCRPSRLRWPKGQERIKDERRRLGGTLTITVEGPAAIELQHGTPQIMERLNTFYGYQAVTEIRIVQGRVSDMHGLKTRSGPPKLSSSRETELEARLGAVEEDELRSALARLGRGALSTADARKAKRRSAQ